MPNEMAEAPDPKPEPAPLNYRLRVPKKPYWLLKAVGSFIAGMIVGILFLGCISLNPPLNPNGLSLRARTGVAVVFCVIASMAIAIAVFALRRRAGEPRNLDDIFLASVLAGAALALFFAGSCYAML